MKQLLEKNEIVRLENEIVIFETSVTCAVGPSVNPLQNRETQHVNIVLQGMYRFF